jgi:hypothetical protein
VGNYGMFVQVCVFIVFIVALIGGLDKTLLQKALLLNTHFK